MPDSATTPPAAAVYNPLESLTQILDGAEDLAVLPQVIMRVLDLTIDSKATSADLEKLISLDQALAAKVLTLANSSYYGMPCRISTLREAVVFLGYKTLRNLAATATTFNLFLGHADTPALARRALWRHSVNTAQCARMIVSLLPSASQEAIGLDQAFTGGLLHDLGKMALDRSRHALFVSITETARRHGVRFSEIESEVTLYSHAQIGAGLAARWNLPPVLCEAIAFHHTPRAASLNPKLAAVICLANEVAHYLEETPDEEGPASRRALYKACHDAVIPLRISGDGLHAITRSCRSELDKGHSSLAF